MKKKTILLTAAVVAIYVLLLILLAFVEGTQEGATIHGFGDALWYSLVTMTTVGYGDLYPVSVAGRIIGFVFVILSIGVLATVLYYLLSQVRERFVPFMRVQLAHGKTCCIFSELNEASEALAEDIYRRDHENRFFFCNVSEEEKNRRQIPAKHLLFRPQNVVDTFIAAAGKDYKYAGSIRVFLISDDILSNYDAALKLEGMPVQIYCRGPETSRFSGVHFFDAFDCTARQYWQNYPVRNEDRTILIVGSGLLAQSILSRAVTVNCRIPFESSCYHLFGDWSDYRNCHPELLSVFCIGREKKGEDCLIFHDEKWNEDDKLVRRADRIIFCADESAENIHGAGMTERFFATGAMVHTAIRNASVGEGTFGDPKTLFTEEMVVKSALDAKARSMHEAYCECVGDQDHPWESLSAFLKDSNRSAADHRITKIRLLLKEKPPLHADEQSCREAYERWKAAEDKDPYRQNEHERWRRFHCFYNWRYGERKNNQKREHPCIVDYEDLSEEERIKDDNAWELIGQ